MEQKISTRILIGAIAVGGVLSVCAIAVSIVVLQKMDRIESFTGEPVQPTHAVVEFGPVSFAGFTGIPVSSTVDSSEGHKSFELRGHVMQNPKEPYEAVLDGDTAIKKVFLDENTKIYRVGARENNEAPAIAEVPLDAFKLDSAEATYVVHYEVKEDSVITDATSASSVSIYVQ